MWTSTDDYNLLQELGNKTHIKSISNAYNKSVKSIKIRIKFLINKYLSNETDYDVNIICNKFNIDVVELLKIVKTKKNKIAQETRMNKYDLMYVMVNDLKKEVEELKNTVNELQNNIN